MATFLDIGILEHFSSIFVVLLVFVIVFGLLEMVKAFGEGKKGLNAIVALVIALLFLVSKLATKMVSTMVPWFIVTTIFIFFVLFLIRMWGLGDSDIKSLIGDSNVYPWLVIIFVIILLTSLSSVFGQSLLEKGSGNTGASYNASTAAPSADTAGSRSVATSSFSTNFTNTVTNPKVLGMIFVFLVGAFSLLFLTKMSTP
jgi:hypothetical protein